MHPENLKSCANCQENAARIGYCIFHHGNMFSFEVRKLNKIKLRSHSEIIWELDACQKEFESRSGIGADTGIWFWFDLSPTSFSKRILIHDLRKNKRDLKLYQYILCDLGAWYYLIPSHRSRHWNQHPLVQQRKLLSKQILSFTCMFSLHTSVHHFGNSLIYACVKALIDK